MERTDLAGVYITDDHIDVIVGYDTAPRMQKTMLSELEVKFTIADGNEDDDVNRFVFRDHSSTKETIYKVCEWIASKAPMLRSIGVASYGPFNSISKHDRNTNAAYGQLQATSHGRLSSLNIYDLFKTGLEKYLGARPIITVDTDVSAAVIGEVYNRSLGVNGTRDKSVDDQVFVFVKVSLGVGAAFMRATTTWHGRLHTEGGQLYAPRWRSGDEKVDADELKFLLGSARNMGSIESLASVRAIAKRFGVQSFHELTSQPTHLAWDREAWYVAHLLWALTCVVSPHRIVLGGRVMSVTGLIEKIRGQFAQIAGSPSFPYYDELDDLDTYIVHASERRGTQVGRPGIIGALCIAAMEHRLR